MKKTRKPTEVPASLKTINVKALLRSRGIYLAQKNNQQYKEIALPIARELLKKKHMLKTENSRSAYFTNEQITEYWEKQIHIVDVIEKRFEHKLDQFITSVTKQFLAHLDSEVNSHKSLVKLAKKDYFADNEDDLLAKAQLDFTPLLNSVAVLAGQEANKLIGIKDPYIPFNYHKQIVDNVNKFTKSMLETDKDTLVNIISHGLQDGKSVPEIRNQIETTFDSYSKMQAQRITRTEVIRASVQASLDAYEQSGVVEGKQWVTFGAIDECASYDGKVVTLGNNFYSGENEFQDGDPPLHPNCRCVVIPIVEGTKTYVPDNIALIERIHELESQIDKRTKTFKELRSAKIDDELYIKSLEKHLGVGDE